MKKVAEYAEQLPHGEKFVSFYYKLNNNIETISYLPGRLFSIHDEITTFLNRLRLYELSN